MANNNLIYLSILLLIPSLLTLAESIDQTKPGCEPVFTYFPYCLEFLVGDYYKPSKKCCDHIEKLNILAKHKTGPRWICWCIEYMVKGKQPRILDSKISQLPGLCHTHLSFPISDSMDCDKV